MKYIVHGNKKVINKSLNEFLDSKLSRLEKYFDAKDIKATINVKINNKEHIIEISIPTSSFTIRAEESSKDLYTSIDLVIDKLERQITKNKNKLKNKYNQSEIMFENIDDCEEDEEELEIVKRKNVFSKPMDEEEALLQMQLVNHDFFAFKNLDEECVSILYKRKDEKYGIINLK